MGEISWLTFGVLLALAYVGGMLTVLAVIWGDVKEARPRLPKG